MSSEILEDAFGTLLVEAGFTRGIELPGSVLYSAEPTIETEPGRRGSVLLTVTTDAFVLMTFIAPTEQFGEEQIDAVRDAGDGYSRTTLHGNWTLGERIDGGILQDFQDWKPVVADPELVLRIRNFLVTRVTALAQYADAVQQRLIRSETELDREAVFGPVQRVLEDPALVANGHITAEAFVQIVRNAYTAVPEQEMFSQLYAYIRSLSMQALGAGSPDSPWYAVSDGLGDLQKQWGWSD